VLGIGTILTCFAGAITLQLRFGPLSGTRTANQTLHPTAARLLGCPCHRTFVRPIPSRRLRPAAVGELVVMPSENYGGMLFIGVPLAVGGVVTSALALAALRPAARGDRLSTLKLAAPAALLGVVDLCVLGFGCVKILSDSDSEILGQLLAFFLTWLVLFGTPVPTSLLAFLVLWRSGRKR
jgi:hypothetical protein